MNGPNTGSTAHGRSSASSVAIVIAIDDRYVDALPAFAGSLSHHNPGIDLSIIGLVPEGSSERALRVVHATFTSAALEVRLVPVTPPVTNPPTYRYVTPTGNFRLLIPDLLPELDRALYLDVDTLVLSDVTPLIYMDLAGKPVAAVRDPYNPCLGWPLALQGPPLPDERARRPYCNAGVLVMDVDQWRVRGIGRAAMELIRNGDERLHFIDQDALNLILDGDFLQLPMTWNFYASGSDSPTERDAKILHFVGVPKPWMPAYPSNVSRKRYQKYQALAAAPTPVDGATCGTRTPGSIGSDTRRRSVEEDPGR